MSKRCSLYNSQSIPKKAKLDILVNSQSCKNASDRTRNTNTKAGISNGQNEDVWGDVLDADAVEDIMFAATQLTQEPNPNVSELPSFTEFRLPQMSSTQIVQNHITNKKLFKVNSIDIDKTQKVASTKLNIPSFSLSKLNKSINTKPFIKNDSFSNPNNTRQKNIEINETHLRNRVEDIKARLHNVNENYDINQLEKLTLEYERLKVEHGKAIDKCLTKEGEVTYLRSQLASTKATIDSLKIEKLHLNEKSRLELNEQLALAKKQINDLSAQLKFKDLEIVNVKDRTRLLESKKIRLAEPQSQRLSDISIHLTSPKNRSARLDKRPTKTIPIQTSHKFKIFLDEVNDSDFPLLKDVPKDFYDECRNEFYKNDITKYSGHKHHDCLSVRSFLSDVYSLSKLSKSELKDQNINSCLFKIMCITRSLMIKVLQSLSEPNKQLQKLLCKPIKKSLEKDNTNIYQATKWKNEVFVDLRRCLAIVSRLVLYCPYIHQFIVESNYKLFLINDTNNWIKKHKNCLLLHHKDENNLLTLLLLILHSLPESNLFLIHEALLLSITEFIFSCYRTISECRGILENIMRTIVFAQASAKVIEKIAELLEYLSLESSYLELLCFDSKEKLSLDFDQGHFKYSKDSCFLQVFAVTLDKCIPENYIHQDEYHFLHNLSHKVINFVHNSMTNNLKWTYPQANCLCLSSIMTSIIVLLNNCVEQYKSRASTFVDNTVFFASLSKILQSGILTLHQLLMRDSEQPDVALQLGYFGGKLFSVVKFASSMKERLFKNSNTISFIEQVLKDLHFYTSPENDLMMNEIFEDTLSNLKFSLTN